MRRWFILWALLVMVVAAIAGWQEIKNRDEETLVLIGGSVSDPRSSARGLLHLQYPLLR